MEGGPSCCERDGDLMNPWRRRGRDVLAARGHVFKNEADTGPEDPPLRPERHIPNSIATMRRRLIGALVT